MRPTVGTVGEPRQAKPRHICAHPAQPASSHNAGRTRTHLWGPRKGLLRWDLPSTLTLTDFTRLRKAPCTLLQTCHNGFRKENPSYAKANHTRPSPRSRHTHLTTLADLKPGAVVQFRDFLVQLESTDGHNAKGRTQSGVKVGVRKTHEVGVNDAGEWYVQARALHVSPSQITQYKSCPRQWALDKIAGVPRAGNRFSDRGGQVHKVLEDWQRYAKPPDLSTPIGAIAYPALAYTPTPGTATPERCVNWDIGGIEIEFLKDLEQVRPDCTEIWDYKTTSNLTYAHTQTELLETDPQAIIYAAHAFVLGAQAVRENWLYLTANKPHRCLPVVVDPEKNACLSRFELIHAVGREMIAHRIAQTDPSTLKQNPAHCSAFGGCPYKGTHCTPDETKELLNQMVSILDQIAAVGLPAPAPAAPAQPPAMSWPPPAAPVAPPAPMQTSPFPAVAQATAAPWLTQAQGVPVTPPSTLAAPADPSFAPLPQASAALPDYLRPAIAPPPATVTPEVVVPPAARVPSKAKKTGATPAPTVVDVAPAREGDPLEEQFWRILEALAMNAGLAAHPAVDLADKAFAIVTCGQKALGK